ncbi:uncharacterized protein LOC126842139 isoform X2 [Adelges cooleyi]|nr:uncharacterized protein LOC126842139 isoform X2 [Adelges cooleyi]
MVEFWYYMGKNESDRIRILKNSPMYGNWSPQNPDLEEFGKLFKQICSERGVFVKDWAASRKAKAAKITIDEIAVLETEQTDDEDEERALRNSFSDCKKWLGEPRDANIGLSGFCCYMGLGQSNKVLDNYLKNNQHAFERMSHNYAMNYGSTQGPIDFTLYCGLFKYICSINGVPLEDLTALRKSEAAARTINEYLSLTLN